MRKWICVGVLGGLLEFGIVYQVAFSDTDSPAPETLRAADNGTPPKPRRAGRASRHLASAVGTSEVPEVPAATAKAAVPATLPADAAIPPAGSPATPAGSPPAIQAAAAPVPGSQDPLTATLIATASVVAAVPEVVAQITGAAPPAPIPGLPLDLSAILPQDLDMAEVVPLPGVAAVPVLVPPLNLASLPIEEMIRQVFGVDGEKAVQVARCESTMRTHAKKGQFLGLFQMGANERADYGHGTDALAQVQAAHALFMDRGWQPWACA